MNNRQPPDRGRVEAKWILCHRRVQFREINVMYKMFCKRIISDFLNQTMNIYYGLPVKTYFIYSVPVYNLDYEHNLYVLSCMYGAEETLNLKYNNLRQFARKLSASLGRPGDHYEGIFALCDNKNGYCRVFDIKYHPPQRMYCIREYGHNSRNEVGYFIAAVTSFQKSVINIFNTTKTIICKRHTSTTPDDSQLCGASSLSDGDEALRTPVEVTSVSQESDDDDDDVDIPHQTPHQGTLAECPDLLEQTAVHPVDNSDERIHLALRTCRYSPDVKPVRKKVVKAKELITTKGYENLRRFIPPNDREPTPLEMFRCEKRLKENNKLNDTWKRFLEHWFDRHQPDGGSKKSGKFQIGNVVYTLEHRFPYIFAVLIFNIMCKDGKCTKGLVIYVRELLNSGPNLDVITEKENSANGKVCEDFINNYVKPKPKIWTDSFHFEDQGHLGIFLHDLNLQFGQNVERNAQHYFKQTWSELINCDSPSMHSIPQPKEFVDYFVPIGNGIFGQCTKVSMVQSEFIVLNSAC